ncbi:MAG: hypothetical protein E7363_06515 [Clostridiales bacterium]|nr:hypothetical protein [Clostridiales bacterium]
MKTFTKLFTATLLCVLSLSLITACGPKGPKKPSVSTNEVITQSVAKMEEMMGISAPAETQTVAFTLPNYTVDYANERLSVLRGSGIGLYFAQYVAGESVALADDVIYKDTVTAEDVTLDFLLKKSAVEGGIHLTMEMHQTNSGEAAVSPIQIYFAYDYTAKKPVKTTIVSANERAGGYDLAVAQFDYGTQTAYSYNFTLAAADLSPLKTALTEKTLDFEGLSEYSLYRYVFAKLHADTGTVEAYGYQAGSTDEISATETEVSTLYNGIYAQVKDACVPVALLDDAAATQKVFYQDMWAYGSSRVMAIE